MNDFSAHALSARLNTRVFGRTAFFHAACASTNDLAAELGRAGATHGTLVVSDTQTGGRGRMGRSWHSPPGDNLYFSLLVRPDLAPSDLPPITLLVGAGIAQALDDTIGNVGPRAQLKWPNDVVLPSPTGPRKVSGVLTEMATMEGRIRQAIIGVGINVNGTQFPDDLANQATSLRLATGRPYDRVALLATVLETLETGYDGFIQHGADYAVSQWRAHALLGYRCRVNVQTAHAPVDGWARDVDSTGALVVEDDQGGRHRVSSGDAATVTPQWRQTGGGGVSSSP